jgi:hypothetical protein
VAVTVELMAYHNVVHAAEILSDTTVTRLVPEPVRRQWREWAERSIRSSGWRTLFAASGSVGPWPRRETTRVASVQGSGCRTPIWKPDRGPERWPRPAGKQPRRWKPDVPARPCIWWRTDDQLRRADLHPRILRQPRSSTRRIDHAIACRNGFGRGDAGDGRNIRTDVMTQFASVTLTGARRRFAARSRTR